MIETMTYKNALPHDVLNKYAFMETGSAAKICESVCPDEMEDIIEVLRGFELTSSLLLTKGGNRGPIPILIDGAFERRGWIEARVDLYKRAFMIPGQSAPTVKDDPLGEIANDHLISEIYQKGYSVDNVKGRVALDVEWNPKDGNLDRDFSAYRAWHSEGLIDVAVLITRIQEDTREITDNAWGQFVESHPEFQGARQTVDYSTTTTANFEKARERVLRGDLGTCPILVVGIGRKTWDEKPWDGSEIKYDKGLGGLAVRDAFQRSYAVVKFEGSI